MRINRAVIAMGIAGVLSTAVPARAFEIFGLKFFESTITEVTIQNPVDYALTFSSPDAPKDLADSLRAASDLWLGRAQAAEGSAGLMGMANNDYRALLATLYSAGYYSPEISILIAGQQASDVPFTAKLSTNVPVEINVAIGPQFRFGEIDLEPLALPADQRSDRVDAVKTSGLVSGDPALAGAVNDAKDLVIEAWRQQGFALATIVGSSIVADHRTQTLDVAMRIDPGKQTTYGQITVAGNQRVAADFVRYMANLPSGSEFDPDDLAAARARLLKLNAFSSVNVKEADALSAEGDLPINLRVNEQPLRRIGLGATLSSIDGLGADAYWIHRNLFGRAERLRFEASLNGVAGSDGLAGAGYKIGLRFAKPGVFLPDVTFATAASAEYVRNDEIERRAVNLSFGLLYSRDHLEAEVSAFGTYSETQDDLGFRTFRQVGLDTGATYDKRNDPLDPSGGYYLAGTLTPMHEFVFGNTGARGTIEGRGYYGVGPDDRFVLAGRAMIGSLGGFPVNEAPVDMLFFSGGGNTVRGFAFETIGITTGTVFTGGLSTINLSAELRMQVTDTIGVVGFIDAGTVGADALPDPSGYWRSGLGIGVRYQTGLGPLRLDIARGLDLQPNDPLYAVYLGLGQSF